LLATSYQQIIELLVAVVKYDLSSPKGADEQLKATVEALALVQPIEFFQRLSWFDACRLMTYVLQVNKSFFTQLGPLMATLNQEQEPKA